MMIATYPPRLLPLLVATSVLMAACGGDSDDSDSKEPETEGVIETNIAPAPCKEDKDCGGDIECGDNGYCKVAEMTVDDAGTSGASLGAPAPCERDSDCGEAKCVEREGGGKFCDVDEMIGP